jgi:hypothetical protein
MPFPVFMVGRSARAGGAVLGAAIAGAAMRGAATAGPGAYE